MFHRILSKVVHVYTQAFTKSIIKNVEKKSHVETTLHFVQILPHKQVRSALICGKNYILFGMKFKYYNRLILLS